MASCFRTYWMDPVAVLRYKAHSNMAKPILFIVLICTVDFVQSWISDLMPISCYRGEKSAVSGTGQVSIKSGGRKRSVFALYAASHDSLPSKSKSRETGSEKKDTAFSAFYRQDPQDSDAHSFLKHLSLSRKKKLQEYFKQLHDARKLRDFKSSDAISAKLRREFGVRVFNNPPVWTTQKGAAPSSYLKKKQSNALDRLRETHGPRGHPYTQVGEGINDIFCPLSMKDIHDLLMQLTLARVEGKDGPLATEAEAIQFELLINGVQFNDETKQWRADGIVNQWDDYVSSDSIDEGGQRVLYAEQSPIKTRSTSASPETSQITESRPRIKQLVQLRVNGMMRGDTDLVQSLALELWKTYSVVIDDTRRTWSFQTQDENCNWEEAASDKNKLETTESHEDILMPPVLFANGNNPWQTDSSFRASDHSREVTDSIVLTRIQYLVAERVQKREEGKFLEADSIRKELWMTYYVGLNDRLRQWSVGGVFDDF